MLILLSALCGFGLDLLLGDPPWMPHPVVLMGKFISGWERLVRPRFPRTPRGEFLCGLLLAAVLPLLTLGVTGGIVYLAGCLHPAAAFAVQTLWSWQALAVRGLAEESTRVYRALNRENLPKARKAVARIVGRDVERLDAEGVAKAAVETVAENFSDGVAAPLLYLFLGGAPLAMACKAVNTMDSMVGYRNERYLWFGRAAARLDDAVNFVPARIAALCWIAAARLTGEDFRNAWRVWRRDARKHVSPNAGQTEAACAGALGIQLGGPAWYFGELHDKAALGDAGRPCVPSDIMRANRMLFVGSVLLLAVCTAVRLVWVLWRLR